MISPERAEQQGKGPSKKDMRAAMEISSFIGDMGMKVLPGKEWGVHYRNPQKREEVLNAVLNGRMDPAQVDIAELKPVGMSYRLQDTEDVGLDGMVGKVRDVANFHKHFDHRGFLDFLAGLQGRDTDLETATRLFSSIGKSRVQSELLRTLGGTGKAQLKKSLSGDADKVMQAEDQGKMQSLLELLKLRWLSKQGVVNPADVARFEGKAGAEIVSLADELEEAYLDYVQKGDADAKKKLAEKVRESFTEIQKQVQADKVDDFVDEMLDKYDELPPEKKQEVDDAFNDYEPPQSDVPPSFNDKFSPSMDEMKETGEKQKVTPLYTVEPPITGLYQGPIYSHFNSAQVKWEMRHNMQPVSSANASKSHVMRGKIGANSILPIYLPRNYAPAEIPRGLQLLKDENGTYYLRNNSGGQREYEIAFGKQGFANTSAPTASETADISSGGFSQSTKNYLNSLHGKNNTSKAQAIIHYMKNVLSLKYSNDSKFNRIYKMNPSRYFAEIEKHKEVDCDVAQTYFIAACRIAGVPSRIVTGHSVDLVENNKAILHGGTGHAWTEIWDEQSGLWKTIDATPEKENDEKDNKDKGKEQQGNNAPKEETDIQAPPKDPSGNPPSPEQVKKKVDDKVEQTQQGQQGQKGQGGQPGQGEGGGKGENSSPPDSAKKKMEEMMDEQGEQGDKGDSKSGGSKGGGSKGPAGKENGGEGEISDDQWKDMEQEMKEMQKKHEEMKQKEAELKEKMKQAESFKDLKALERELDQSELYDEAKEQLEKKLEAKEEQAKKELKDEIKKMMEDGFITEEQAEKMLKDLEAGSMDAYTKAEQQLEHESALYNEYEEIREEVMPLVDEWFEFFASRLPKIEEIDYDEDVQSRSGRFDRRSIGRPRNLMFGRTQNPLIISQSVMPRFMASLVIDISGSMSSRMKDARKLLIFFSELFDKISEEFGYIQFSISAFDTTTELIKDFDQKYNASDRYNFGGSEKTVKVRLMETTMARGGTDMGKAVWEANKKLNEAKLKHPNYLSALYTISDGETGGELAGERLKRFLDGQESFWEEWWGQHMKCGFMLGAESQKATLAQYFGEDNAEAVPDMRDLIEKVMNRFDQDSQGFIDSLPKE